MTTQHSLKTLPLRGATQPTEMPALGFGTYQIDSEQCQTSVAKAIECGYRHIDTAQFYDNESGVGRAIKSSGIARADLFLTTKVWIDNFAPGDLEQSVEESLNKLQCDYVDLLLLHWPNPDVKLSDTLKSLQSVQEAGKCRAIGVSNFTTKLITEACSVLGDNLACNQVEYHVLLSQKPVLDACRQHDMALTAYSPLAQGRLREHPTLTEIGLKYGKSASQVALRWLIDQPGVAAIPKAASEANMKANIDILDFELSAEDYTKLNELNAKSHERVVNPGIAPQWDKAA